MGGTGGAAVPGDVMGELGETDWGGKLFIASIPKSALVDFSSTNPRCPNRVLTRCSRHAPFIKLPSRLLIWGYRVLREVHACCFIMDQSMG